MVAQDERVGLPERVLLEPLRRGLLDVLVSQQRRATPGDLGDGDDGPADRVVRDHDDPAVLGGLVGPGLLTVRAHAGDPTPGWQTHRVILDGGLSNALTARGHDLSDALWTARLLRDAPDEIAAVHRSYFAAGAEVATTASYQASVPGFERAGMSRRRGGVAAGPQRHAGP